MDFVTFEIAKKLEEKGYPQIKRDTLAMYNEDEELLLLAENLGSEFVYLFEDFDRNDYVAPTISQTLKWLREERGYNVNMRIYSPDRWYWTIQDREGNPCRSHLTLSDDLFETYEDAALAGVAYCLENLI